MPEWLRRLGSDTIGEWLAVMATRVVAAVGVLLLTFVASRYAGTEALGRVFFGLSVLVGLSHLARLGRDQACLRRAAMAWHWQRHDVVRRLARRTSLGVFATGAGLGVVGVLAWPAFADTWSFIARPNVETTLLVAAVPLYGVMLVWAVVLKATARAPLAAFFEVGGPCTLTAIVMAAAVAAGVGVDGPIIAGTLVASMAVLAVLGGLVFVRRLHAAERSAPSATAPTGPDAEGRKGASGADVSDKLWDIAPALAIFTTANFVMQWTPSLTLGSVKTAHEVGLYAIVFQTSAVISFALLVANTVLPRHIVRTFTSGDLPALERLIRRAALATSSLAAIPALILLVVPDWVLAQFGTSDTDAVQALRILALGQFVNVLCGSVMSVLNMTGHERKVMRIVLATAGLHLVLQLALIPAHGVVGAAAATATAMVFQNALGVLAVRRSLGVMPVPAWRRLRPRTTPD